MTKTEFHSLLTDSSKLSFEFAKNYVHDNLPNDFKYTVKLNVSHDDPNLKQFDIYPSDNDKTVELITATEVVDLLCRKNKVPVWLDISVESFNKNHTVFQLLCAGRYSDDANEFYYQKSGTGPFGIKSPVLPASYKDEQTKFSLKKKKSFFAWLTKT
ncbi:MAG: hypothetical protein QE487_09690 [Fluviicola sp.]|nr:hypothetical protein [Fluviicola sp.]